ncbi:MAG TPA: pitrilysin family protein [Haloplasmataceae bacterium]
MERTTYKINGLNVTLIKTDKFKTTDFVLNFRQKLDPNTVTSRALVPYVLKARTKKYPSKKAINQKLEELYGASFGVSINKQGLLHILSLRMSIINERYLTTQVNLLEEALAFFQEIIFNPELENGAFLEKVVNEEKRLLKEEFEALFDDKIRYSYHKLIEIMCKEENYRIKSIGRLEDLDNIDHKNLYATYQKILNEDTIDLLMIGDIDFNYVKSLIEKYLPFKDRKEIQEVADTQTKEIRTVEKVVEVKDVSQAKLNIGFRTNTTGIDPDYYPLILLNAMLGVYPHSLLFRNVREKESLCYYIASNIDKGKGIMVIYAGINHQDYQKAYDLIIKQLKTIKKGDFDDSLIENSRKALINDLLQTNDNTLAFLASEYSHHLFNEIFDTEQIIKKINAVTKSDIEKVAQKIEEDTVFLLTSEEVSN